MTRPLPGVPLVALRLVVLLLAGLWPSAAEPYSRTTTDTGNALFWTEREVTLNLVLPCLPDACYEAAAIEAAQAWTAAGARFTFHTTTSPLAGPCHDRDGRNTVSASSTNCGMDFQPGVAALTGNWARLTGEIVEADVVFNSGVDWGIYEGPRRGSAVDFYRAALHEFGHVLGLAHPDEHGQVVSAMMNSRAAFDRLQADDIAGIRAIYGVGGTPPPPPPPAEPVGALENPGNRSFKSGIGVVSGWVCNATRVEVAIGNTRIPVVYGTSRGDTASVCGDTNNGFVTLVNWNLLGEGVHTMRLVVDGVAIGLSKFKVTTFRQEFLRGASGEYSLLDFPRAGSRAVIEWEQSSQNFVITRTE